MNRLYRRAPSLLRLKGYLKTWLSRRAAIAPEDRPFVDFVGATLDREAYLRAHEDVNASGLDPVVHWLDHGLLEGRSLAPGWRVRLTDRPVGVKGDHAFEFRWRGRTVIAEKSGISDAILGQVLAQARHDHAVVAPGPLAIPSLPVYDAADLTARDGVDVERIFSSLPAAPDVLVLMPYLCAGGAEKYTADLVASLKALGRTSVTVVVTEQLAEGWEALEILSAFRSVDVVDWPRVCGSGHDNPAVLARLLHALRPTTLVVVNSRVGLEAIARFGRGLSQVSRIYCAYFSLGRDGLGAPYGTRFPRLTMPYSRTLSDNVPTAEALNRLWGGLGPDVAVLPPRVAIAERAVFQARLERRLQRRTQPGPRPSRWLWISRIEHFKGSEILKHLAMRRPHDRFELYGPLQTPLAALGLVLPNVTHGGVLNDIERADFSGYDGFLFTSLYEGMPNVVLELSQHGIPLVLADVGGLTGTFDASSATFVQHADSPDETAGRFSLALEQVERQTPDQLAERVTAAYEAVARRHGHDAHRGHVDRVFNQ